MKPGMVRTGLMMDEKLTHWLLENGGPVVRYRTAVELAASSSRFDLAHLERDLLASPSVRKWLNNLRPGGVHGSKDVCFENAMGKLLELGLRAGMKPLDKKTGVFLSGLAGAAEARKGMFGALVSVIVASGLARAGYGGEEPVRAFLIGRLDMLYETIQRFGHDIYVDADAFSDMPKAWRIRNRPLVNPAICPEGRFGLPYIHDLYGLSALAANDDDSPTRSRIDAVVRYVLDRRHQALEPAYGLLRQGKGRYYAIGWRTDLPGYGGFNLGARGAKALAQRVELMAHFRAARNHPWLINAVRHLEAFRTERGSYRFPRSYLQESSNRYWVLGMHMGLEEDRRRPEAMEIESTFRMLRIRRLIAGSDSAGELA